MANKFLHGSGNSAVTKQNTPSNWYAAGVNYESATDKTTLDVTAQLSQLGYVDAELSAANGDVRKFIHSIVEHLYLGYAANAGTDPTNHGSDNFKMAKATSHNPTDNTRLSTFTIFVKEDGNVTGEASYAKGSFTATGMTSDV